MNRLRSISLSLCCGGVLLVLPGCAHTPGPASPPAVQQAERHNFLGIAAESRQQFARAESEFAESRRFYRSIEDHHGTVTTLINSSRLYRLMGERNKTARVLDEAVSLLPYVPGLEAEVCFEKAKLALLDKDYAAGLVWASRAAATAATGDRSRMLNLQAQVLLHMGELGRAEEVARSALDAAQKIPDRREEANAYRLLAGIANAGGRFDEAVANYGTALAVDKELALSVRMADDLRGLASATAASGRSASAAEFYRRAAAISIARKDFVGAAEDLETLRTLYEAANDGARASEVAEILRQIRTGAPVDVPP